MLLLVIFLTVARIKCCAWKTWAVAFAISGTGIPFAATLLKLLAAFSYNRQLRPIRNTLFCFSHPQFDGGGSSCMVTFAWPPTWPAWTIARFICGFRTPFVGGIALYALCFWANKSSRVSSTLHKHQNILQITQSPFKLSILCLAEHGSNLDFRLNSASLFFASGSLKNGFCESIMPFIKCLYCFSPMLTS